MAGRIRADRRDDRHVGIFDRMRADGAGFTGPIELLGVPSSAVAHWPGPEKAPQALRSAGRCALVTALSGRPW